MAKKPAKRRSWRDMPAIDPSKLGPLPELDPAKMQPMRVVSYQLRFDHWDPAVIKEAMQFLGEKYGVSASLLNTYEVTQIGFGEPTFRKVDIV